MFAYHDIEGVTSFRCPHCGSTEGMVAVTPIGVAIAADGELEADPEVLVGIEDECDCNVCDYSGALGDFLAPRDGGKKHHKPALLPVADLGPNVIVLRPD